MRLSLAALGGLAATLAVCLILGRSPASARTAAVTRYVAPGADCGGQAPCYAGLQQAVDDVPTGQADSILVAQGTYTGVSDRAGVTQVVYIDKPVLIQGGFTTDTWTAPDPEAYPAIVDAQGLGRVVFVAVGVTPTLDGLRLVDGWATDGGGVYANGAFVTIRRCLIMSNTAAVDGGGLNVSNGSATLEGNTFQGNSAGGSGGGLALLTSLASLDGNLIRGNTAGTRGGGLGLSGLANHTTVLTNNVIVNNDAVEGASVSQKGGRSHFLHTTLVGNASQRPYIGVKVLPADLGDPASLAAFTNTILSDHVVGIWVTAGNTVTLRGVLWHATTLNVLREGGAFAVVQDEWTGDPTFFEDGYHLRPRSAAIDRAVDAGLVTDFDGDARPIGPAPDLGADETPWQWWRYLPLVFRK